MKRLIFCFDGSWNRLDAPNPTNVVITAQSIIPVTPDGVTQIIHYDEGVGTAAGESLGGGLFGHGLLTNIADAYRFLIFNYMVGDEIYIFGFSRGAYTARSFAGFLRNCGIIRRRDAGKITEAVEMYKTRKRDEDQSSDPFQRFRWECSPDLCVDAAEDAWRASNCKGYAAGQAPVLRIRYLGVWDTVGALGVPDSIWLGSLFNKKYQFHDHALSRMVVSARHAVAIDERRKAFSPTLWTNLDSLNAELGFESTAEDAPYQQKWFPGTHGSVGGGGDIRGLSDEALDWVIRGARKVGLRLDIGETSPIFRLFPDPRAPLVNVTQTPKFDVMKILPSADRLPGPDRVEDVSVIARTRWSESGADLPERVPYRPKTLDRVKALLEPQGKGAAAPTTPRIQSIPSPKKAPGVTPGFYTVKRGDTLSEIAETVYGDASRYQKIFEANRRMLTHPDQIYPGQVLQIPE